MEPKYDSYTELDNAEFQQHLGRFILTQVR